jgi:restriction endonuclease S subunit
LNQRVVKLTLSGDVDEDFFFHFMQTQLAQIERMGRHALVNNVSISDLKTLGIPLPPLFEQRRIAAILDKADALRAKRREAIAKLDQLLQSVFLDMFGDQRTNPKGWSAARIDEVAECLDRFRKPVTAKDRVSGDVPYYGANGQQGWIDRAIFNEPLVLVAEDGGHFDCPERGVAYRIDGAAWVNNHAHILRARPGLIETEYLHRALRHFDFMPYISGSTRAKLTQGQLNMVPVLVPPLDLQRAFAQIVERIQAQETFMHRSAGHLDVMFRSHQHRAFTGTL